MTNRFIVNDETACIAVLPKSGSILEWKTRLQCVWDDCEFSHYGLELESKTSIRQNIEQDSVVGKKFFTDVIKLRNAGLRELLDDLVLMQEQGRDDPDRVHRLYKRIESHRLQNPNIIK